MRELEEKWRRGAKLTNEKLTSEGRKTAAVKGWRLRKKRLAAKS